MWCEGLSISDIPCYMDIWESETGSLDVANALLHILQCSLTYFTISYSLTFDLGKNTKKVISSQLLF